MRPVRTIGGRVSTDRLNRLLAANSGFVDRFDRGHLTAPPLEHLAVLTCMDARIAVEQLFGLNVGDVAVVRNAGAVASDDAIRSLLVTRHVLGTNEIVVMAHTGCGLRGLDEGIRRLGPLVTLELPAIELELRAGRYDRALARLEQVSSQSPRKETWLARRGEILELANRAPEALAAYSACLEAVEILPPDRRRTAAMTELTERVRSAMSRLRVDSER